MHIVCVHTCMRRASAVDRFLPQTKDIPDHFQNVIRYIYGVQTTAETRPNSRCRSLPRSRIAGSRRSWCVRRAAVTRGSSIAASTWPTTSSPRRRPRRRPPPTSGATSRRCPHVVWRGTGPSGISTCSALPPRTSRSRCSGYVAPLPASFRSCRPFFRSKISWRFLLDFNFRCVLGFYVALQNLLHLDYR